MFVILGLIFFLAIQSGLAKPIVEKPSFEEYLNGYGYIEGQDMGSEAAVADALKNFQQYARLPVTGILDNATIAKITGPRCGSRDNQKAASKRRFKRFERQGSSWRKKELTYSIHGTSRPAQKISSTTVKDVVEKSFKMWQDVIQLSFKGLPPNDPSADMIIRFYSGSHGDPYPFDGPSGRLAHGYYPSSNSPGLDGDIHYDDDETWTIDGEPDTVDFTWTTVHEIGHAIGLSHSNEPTAIMWPWFEKFEPGLQLKQDDIAGAQSIYGKRTIPTAPTTTTAPPTPSAPTTPTVATTPTTPTTPATPTTSTTPTAPTTPTTPTTPSTSTTPTVPTTPTTPATVTTAPTTPTVPTTPTTLAIVTTAPTTPTTPTKAAKPPICNTSNFDAVMYDETKRNTYFLKGEHVWIMDDKKTLDGNHELISEKWPGLEGDLDSAYIRNDGDTIFFKGNRFWRYRDFRRMEGPKALSRYINHIPPELQKIDGVTTWVNGRTYFFNEALYWRYDEQAKKIDDGYPKSMKYWRFIPHHVNDAITWKKGKTLFFVKETIYVYRYTRKVNEEKAIPLKHFLKVCRD